MTTPCGLLFFKNFPNAFLLQAMVLQLVPLRVSESLSRQLTHLRQPTPNSYSNGLRQNIFCVERSLFHRIKWPAGLILRIFLHSTTSGYLKKP
ncbi:hypothetical protein TNIN_219471 [Trichonephila inaurata madagascariensis]|uniref:Uncharacterized protein n=1 Tax=Trichonephila inaurata madagascariensis TaxID=2747483 RepID=A0A8X6Y6J4_9ARAC|nr:hypothetical protein TNIN_219471 [Trichonephila inaurata madagascariensis]